MTLNIDLSNFNEDWSRIIFTNPVNVKDGYVELEEDRIGWGADLNYEEIVKYPYNPGNFLPLFRAGWEKRKPVD
jgi:galactonate dehydratase